MSGTSFRVLGPVEVWRDGRPLPAQTPRHRAVLAALLVDAGRTVAVDVLADRVWSGQPPTAVSATLQAVISRLRRELEPDAAGTWTLLLTREPGYRLAVDPEDVDAVRFTRLVRTARELAARDDVPGARAAVGEGLELWRGPAYADVAATFAVEEAERLEQARLDARELAADLDLRLGRHAELVDDLRELVRAEPLREGLRASLMLALYRAGRQAEALEVYAEGRRLLADGLGVDPGRPLQQLHERILRQDPALAASAPAAAPAPPPAPAPVPAAAPAPATGPLPVPLTAFVGRARELGVLAGTLAGQRLVTLVGPGGSGKTRLALEAARRRPGGAPPAALVELAGVEDPDLVAAQVATVLGVSLTAGDPLGAVTTALQGRPLLLLLDNCEHVVEAAAAVCAILLPRCPDLQVLATSREPLGLPGEAVLPCGPMPAGTPGSDAEQLFLDRARLAAPHLADPSAEELQQVRELCVALDGLPLAVELAAACLTTLPLAEVAARVDDRFALLSGGWRTAPPHQRTLAATVQWSVDLLDPAELAVFRAVSVLPGTFGPDAVDAVAGPEVEAGTLELLRELVAKSLVELDHAAGRYRMLETLRQYAEQGLDPGTARRLRDRHAGFVLALTERLEPTLRRAEWSASARRLDAEQPGLRAALAHALATGQGETALRIGAALAWWWYRRGHVQEGRRWLAAALETTSDAPAHVRSGALLGDALLAYLSGDVASIFARTNEIVTAAEDERDAVLALALVLRGFVRALLGQADAEGDISRDIARGLELAQASGIEWVQAEIAMTLGQFARVAGDAEGALAHLAAAEQLALDLGHSWAHSSVLWIRAKVLVDLGRADEALADLWRMVDLTHREGDATGTLAGLLTAVGAVAAAGRHREAAVLLGSVQASARLIGYDPLRMDPMDGQRYVAATRAGLDDGSFAAAVAEGAGIDLAGACALVGRSAGEVRTGGVADIAG